MTKPLFSLNLTILLSLLLFPLIARAGGDSDFEQEEEYPYIPEILRIADDKEADELEAAGVLLLYRRDNLALALVPNKEESAEKGNTRRAPRRSPLLKPTPNRPTLDVAATHFGASDINKGSDLPAPYTGKGVVAGFCDVGFDPSHPTFLDADGNPRVKRLVEIRECYNEIKTLDTPEEILAYTTDDPDNWHGSHVAGILAGNGADSPYSSLAPDCEIVATMSMLSDVGLLIGAEKIVEYAQAHNKPAVINLSMGNCTGPHDGTSLFSQYLDKIGKDAIVVISAGNDAGTTNNLLYSLDSDHPKLGFKLNNFMIDNLHVTGMTDIWSKDSRRFNLSYCLYDDPAGAIRTEVPVELSEENPVVIFSSDPATFGGTSFPLFPEVYKGYIIFIAEKNPDNGRYHVELHYDLETDEKAPGKQWARHTSALLLTPADAEAGADVEIYGDAARTRIRQMAGYPAPSNLRSISDLATGHNVLSVGMYNSRQTYPLVDGSQADVGYENGKVNPHSSYSTLNDGRVLPLTVAPGAGIVSAGNSYCEEAHPGAFTGIAHISRYGDREYSWLEDSGTSMSAPYVASVVATMLQANPLMRIETLKHFIATTNSHDYPDPENPRHGAGWFRPLEAVKLAAKDFLSVLPQPDESPARLSVAGDALRIFNPTGKSARISVVAPDGRTLFDTLVEEEDRILSLADIPEGIYIATARIDGMPDRVIKFVRF